VSDGIVVTDQGFGNVTRERALADRLGVGFAAHQCRTEEETVGAAVGADVVLVNFAPITRRVLDVLGPRATVIRYGVGYDNVDVGSASELGIRVCNVPDYGAETVADHTVSMLLALLRNVAPLDRAVRERGWLQPSDLGSVRGFTETAVGLIGTGRIGRAVAARLQPFGFTILAHDPFVDDAQLAALSMQPVGLDELLRSANAISLHAPLTERSRHLIGEASLRLVRPGAVIVNTARGGLVDERALVAALRSGRLGGAALDVFEKEPLPEDSDLRTIPSVLLTPHASFFSDSSLANLQRLATDEAERALSGRTLRCQVN
jgi:D-3-phosphoglycerate dehydrogenase